MTDPVAVVFPRSDGGLDVVGIGSGLAALLLALPATIAEDAPPEVQARLFPDVSETDEHANTEWRQLVRPELFHLLASAREVVASDLRGLAISSADGAPGRLEIPGKHRDAWISGLQAARVALGARHRLDVYDPDPPAEGEQHTRAVAEITMALYADLQGQLVEGALDDLPGEIEDDDPDVEAS